MKLCVKCKTEIPEGRLKALPGTTTCVNCSSSKMKRSITVTKGEGEDTYNDIIIFEADEYEKLYGKDNTSTSFDRE
jgi:RNA polymerase-binding transcription factor DksA